jgi:mannonate dehydratase
MLGNSPERDKEIEMIKQMIKVASEVGVKKLLYNTTILPVLRTGYTKDPTRGNTLYHTWNYEEALKDGLDKKELKEKGTVNREEMYNRIKYLLDRILPVAEKYDIKLGNHIADPPLPKPFDGILRWDSPNVIKQIKHFAKLYDSDSHGFNLCLGTTAEGLKGNKTKQLVSIIKWLGKRKQIFNVHMRNIRGGFNNFMETYPDNGDNDFLQIVRALRDVEYDGMIMPDHVPKHPDPESELQSFAFAFGYNKALIQAVADEVS